MNNNQKIQYEITFTLTVDNGVVNAGPVEVRRIDVLASGASIDCLFEPEPQPNLDGLFARDDCNAN